MDEIDFLREKIRRDTQELLNALDKAASEEDPEKQIQEDITAGLKYMIIHVDSGIAYTQAISSKSKDLRE